MFIGRIEELRELKEKYNSKRNEFICVLGRRRIGKSQLIFESYKDFKGKVISFECFDTGYKDNLEKLTEIIRKEFNNNYLSFNSIYEVMMFLHKESKNGKLLFILDEYPYIRENRTVDSLVKNAIDDINKNESSNKFKFVICGSSVQIMNTLNNSDMPLHGRFTKIINLEPLNYLYSSLFYPKSSYEDKVKYYSIFGGVPYYLKQVDQNKSFDENIINLFFKNNSLLSNELEKMINIEINKIEKASFLLTQIKDKKISYSDLLSKYKSYYQNGEIDYALNKLIEMKIIKKIYILNNNKVKKPYYYIYDNSIVFYYSFLFIPFANRFLYTDKDYYEEFIKEKLNKQFVPKMFEKIGFEFISLMNKNNMLPYKLIDLFPYGINDKKTKKNYQFDIVGKCKEGLINFECKFKDGNISSSNFYEEKRQAELSDSNFIKTIFISKSKVDVCNSVYYLKDLFNKDLLIKETD